MHLSLPAPRSRLLVVVALLVAQTAFFLLFLVRPLAVIPDDRRYEEPGWQCATHGTLLMPFSLMPDETVRGWVCTRHPDACIGELYPSASYPPGYSFFIAALYRVVGRSLTALVFSQYLMLLVLFVLFERLAYRLLDGAGYWFVVVVGMTYPFIARQASIFESDHLHAVLLLGALASFMLLRPGVARGALFGALLAAATLTRPYSIVCIPVLFLWPAVWRGQGATLREWAVAAGVGAVPFVLWAARNYYWYGHFIPLTTTGLGAALYTLSAEWHYRGTYGSEAAPAIYKALFQYGDPMTWGPNHRLMQDALVWLRANPLPLLAMLLLHVPKVFVSLGIEGHGLSPAVLLIVPYLGILWLLGVVGLWLTRGNPRWYAIVAIVLPYWAMLVPFMEARRTLPLRLPMLLAAGLAVSRLWQSWQRRRGRSPAA